MYPFVSSVLWREREGLFPFYWGFLVNIAQMLSFVGRLYPRWSGVWSGCDPDHFVDEEVLRSRSPAHHRHPFTFINERFDSARAVTKRAIAHPDDWQ
jgi:hypothetical protein